MHWGFTILLFIYLYKLYENKKFFLMYNIIFVQSISKLSKISMLFGELRKKFCILGDFDFFTEFVPCSVLTISHFRRSRINHHLEKSSMRVFLLKIDTPRDTAKISLGKIAHTIFYPLNILNSFCLEYLHY